MNNPTNGTVLPRCKKEEMHVLSVQEQMQLTCVLHLHRLGFAILFDLATGFRIGELCALKWFDVDFDGINVEANEIVYGISCIQSQISKQFLTFYPPVSTSINEMKLAVGEFVVMVNV